MNEYTSQNNRGDVAYRAQLLRALGELAGDHRAESAVNALLEGAVVDADSELQEAAKNARNRIRGRKW